MLPWKSSHHDYCEKNLFMFKVSQSYKTNIATDKQTNTMPIEAQVQSKNTEILHRHCPLTISRNNVLLKIKGKKVHTKLQWNPHTKTLILGKFIKRKKIYTCSTIIVAKSLNISFNSDMDCTIDWISFSLSSIIAELSSTNRIWSFVNPWKI